MGALSPKAAKEIRRCADDFHYFCSKYLRIVDKAGRVVALKPNRAQRDFLEADQKNPWVYVLKGRKRGLTTIIAALNFHSALFTPYHYTLVLAHTENAAKSIFRIYSRFYENLPAFLKFPVKLQNKHELEFEHGGYICAATAGSDSARGGTYQAIHCSEFAMYENIEALIASALNTAGENPRVTLETTANGLNDAHRIWSSQGGFEKLFISWLNDEDAFSKKKPEWVPKEIAELAVTYKLTQRQLNWAADTYLTRCAANWNTFLQEYPPEAHLAFISSGKRFFNHAYAHAKPQPGYSRYQEPLRYRAYVMGVDTASGSEHGDYSAWCLLDCTNKRKPEIVSTFYEKISPSAFAQRVKDEAEAYNALVCVESNSYGLSIIEYLVNMEYVHLYRRVKYDAATDRYTHNIGFATTSSTRSILMARIQEYISQKWLDPIDGTLQAEMNTFVFNKSGKPTAEVGKHDDLVMATALALVAFDQVDAEQEIKQRKAPRSVAEVLQFEMQTGRLYRKSKDLFGEDDLLAKNVDEAPMGNAPSRF
jgi:hypothetical protein